jgi:hypothetical protein
MATFMGFEEAIKNHLDELAKKDNLFAKTYAKPNKSIKECCNYIMAEAKKQAKSGQIACADEEVFGLAVHYYDEDDIKAPEKVECKVVSAPEKAAKPKAKRKSTPKATAPVVDVPVEDENLELDIPIF